MRSYLPAFQLRQPASLDDALRALAEEPGVWRPFAGGTDLMVLLEAGSLRHQRFISLRGIPELRGVEVTEAALSIGAMSTYTDLLKHQIVQAEFPLLCDAASQTGGVATQHRGTIGGNIGNGSPAADTPPALLVYDAELELVSARGARRVRYDRFHTGYKTSDLAADELIARIHLPRRPDAWCATYRKVGTRRAQAIAKVCFAAASRIQGDQVEDIRIAFGSVAPTVVRAVATEQVLRGQQLSRSTIAAAVESLATVLSPIDDIRSTARYRGFVARQVLTMYLQSLGSSRIC